MRWRKINFVLFRTKQQCSDLQQLFRCQLPSQEILHFVPPLRMTARLKWFCKTSNDFKLSIYYWWHVKPINLHQRYMYIWWWTADVSLAVVRDQCNCGLWWRTTDLKSVRSAAERKRCQGCERVSSSQEDANTHWVGCKYWGEAMPPSVPGPIQAYVSHRALCTKWALHW